MKNKPWFIKDNLIAVNKSGEIIKDENGQPCLDIFKAASEFCAINKAGGQEFQAFKGTMSDDSFEKFIGVTLANNATLAKVMTRKMTENSGSYPYASGNSGKSRWVAKTDVLSAAAMAESSLDFTCEELALAVFLSDTFIEDSGNDPQAVANYLSESFGNDLLDCLFNGDDTTTDVAGDRKLMLKGHDGLSPVLTAGNRVINTAAAATITDKLALVMAAVPSNILSAKKAQIWMSGTKWLDYYTEALAMPGSAAVIQGDRLFFAGAEVFATPSCFDIKVAGNPLVFGDIAGGRIWAGNPQAIGVGIKRNIFLEAQRNALARGYNIVLTCRVDFDCVESEMALSSE